MRIIGPPRSSGIYLESTGDERYGVLPGEDRPVRDVMSREVIVVDSSMPVHEALGILHRRGVAGLVVCDHDRLLGVFTEREATVSGHKMVGEAMPREPVACRDDAIVADAARSMAELSLPSLPVIDGTGAVVGLITMTDAATAVSPGSATAWLTKMRKTAEHPNITNITERQNEGGQHERRVVHDGRSRHS